MTVRTRFAPSPTGLLHIGGVRTALFCWLYSKRHHGTFVLRIEDTDRERSTEAAIQVILDGMKWVGLPHDEGPFYQTQRFGRYKEVIDQFLRAGKAYRCYCTKEELDAMRAAQQARGEKPRYDGRCRKLTAPREGVPYVVRFKNPEDGQTIVEDVVHGRVVFENTELDDLIIARSDGTPTYNFCVVVDDSDMKITHVIRGDDHLNNTPRQMNMLLAMGGTPPVYCHLPMILGPDGTKLSKRHGAVSVLEYRKEGYLPEALLNYLVRLGWSHGDQEVFTLEEMAQHFDVVDVNKAATAINPDKLNWLNQQHMMRAEPARLAGMLREQLAAVGIETDDLKTLEGIVIAQRERSKTFAEMARNSVYFFRDFDSYDEKAAKKSLTADAAPLIRQARDGLAKLDAWTAQAVHDQLTSLATALGVNLGKIAQPLRVAVAGGSVSPPIDQTLALAGRERVLKRIDRALDYALKGSAT